MGAARLAANVSPPVAVAILGLGYLGLPLADVLHRRGHPLLAARRSAPPQPVPFALQTLDIGHAAAHDWSAWAAYPVWVCLLPPSGSPDYVAALGHWLRQARALGVRQVVYSSSISVYGAVQGHCDEHTPLAPQTDSARKVVAAEAAFLNSGVANVDVLRLGGLYSDCRHPLFSLQKKPLNGGGAQPVNMLSQQQAVAALLQAIEQPGGVRVRTLVAPQHPPKEQFYRAEAQRLGVAAPTFDPQDQTSDGKIVCSAYRDFDAVFTENPSCPHWPR